MLCVNLSGLLTLYSARVGTGALARPSRAEFGSRLQPQ